MHRPTRRPHALPLLATALCLALGGGLQGCATPAGAGGAGTSATGAAGATAATRPARHAYTETISSVLFSQDEQHLVAIGSDHHYVFDAPELVVRAVRSPGHDQLTVVFSTFHVDAQGGITGTVGLQVPANAPAAAQQAAEQIGLVRRPDGQWEATATLRGHRYTGWTYRVGLAKDKLSRSHTIEVTTDQNLVEQAADKAATPLRIAADGVQLVYYAPLAPIILPVIFLTMARDH